MSGQGVKQKSEWSGCSGEGRAVARRRRVATRPMAFRPEIIEVTSGLEPGEVIATTGVRELRDGQVVRVREGVAHGVSTQSGS